MVLPTECTHPAYTESLPQKPIYIHSIQTIRSLTLFLFSPFFLFVRSVVVTLASHSFCRYPFPFPLLLAHNRTLMKSIWPDKLSLLSVCVCVCLPLNLHSQSQCFWCGAVCVRVPIHSIQCGKVLNCNNNTKITCVFVRG